MADQTGGFSAELKAAPDCQGNFGASIRSAVKFFEGRVEETKKPGVFRVTFNDRGAAEAFGEHADQWPGIYEFVK